MPQLIRFFLYLFIPSLIAFSTYRYLERIFFKPLNPNSKKTVLFELSPSDSFQEVCEKLAKRKIIYSPNSLCVYARLKGHKDPVLPGEYKLSASLTPAELLEKFSSGDTFKRLISIEPGSSVWDIGSKFEAAGILKKEEFETAVTNPEYLARAGIAANSFEGYLAPGDYQFTRPVEPLRVVWTMLERSEEAWIPAYNEQLDKLRLSRHELLTLASIIEETTQDPQERQILSSVLHNRLEKGLRLKSEEALIYGLKDFRGILTEKEKSTPSPFNTFLNFGLPPGPISNPSMQSLEIALYPQETDYITYAEGPLGNLVFGTEEDAEPAPEPAAVE